MRRIMSGIALIALVAGACTSAGPTATPQPTSSPAASESSPAATAPAATPTASSLGFTPGTKASPRQVDVTADDELTFWPNVVVVAEGETVTFNVTTTGKAEHEFMLGPLADALADKEGTPELEGIEAGETKSLTFTFDGHGPYAFVCHEPGHLEKGMLGYIVVVGPDVPTVGTKDIPRLVEVSMDDHLKFSPSGITVKQGETIRFLVTNAGTVTHEFAVGPKDKVDADEIDGTIVKEVDEIEAHQLKILDYTFDGSGPYGFACHEPGHFEAGMKGSIVLSP